MLSEGLVRELNEQIMHEFFSANYYLAMAAYCAANDFSGFAHFFIVQAEEERFHAMKFFNYLNERGARALISGFQEPKNNFASLEEVFSDALAHERFVTKRIYKLIDLASEEREHATISFLNWFVDEQVEEEASMSEVLAKVKMLGEKGHGIYILDKELSQRVFVPPTDTKA